MAFLCGIFSGILRTPDSDSDPYKTRTREKPGLEKNPDSTLGLTFEKSRTCLHKTRTGLIKKTDFKTGLIKKRGFTPVFKITRPKHFFIKQAKHIL